MNTRKLFTFLLLFILSTYAQSSDDLSYIDGSIPFTEIKDVNRESEAWATCSAAFEVMSMLLKENSAQARKVKDLSNGAKMSVIMSHVKKGLSSDITPSEFGALWSYSKTLGDTITETRSTMIMADVESLGGKGAETFIKKLSTTIKICQSNLEAQQSYIDLWREVAKSGLLTQSKQ